MRLGMFMMPVHPPDRPFWSTLEEDTEKSLLADQLGFRRALDGRAFLRHHRADPLAADVPRQPRSPRTKNLALRHRGRSTCPITIPAIVAAEAAQFDHMSKGRFHARRRARAGSSPTSSCSRPRRPCAQPHGGRGRSTSSSASGRKIRPMISRRVLEHRDQGRDHAGARRRLHAEAVPASRGRRSRSRSPARARPRRDSSRLSGLGHHLGQHHPDLFGGAATGRSTARPAREARHHRRAATTWRVSRNVHGGALRPASATSACSASRASNRYFYTYMREVLGSGRACLSILKPRPDMPDDEATRRGHHHGMRASTARRAPCSTSSSPSASSVGRSSTLLMTGLDWGGPNASVGARNRCGCWRDEVMPKFRQHVDGQ